MKLCCLFARCIIILLGVLWKTEGVVKLPPNVTVPAVFVFGDSIVDTGNNNNNLLTTAKCNYPPYGKDFKGGKATGRFSNGKVPSDLIVEDLGIKEFLPAYLDPNLKSSDLLTGVNFASGGAGYDSLTSQTAFAISISGQVDLFKECIGKLKAEVGEERANFIIKNSFYILVFGSNDISNTYFLSRIRQLHYDIPSYTQLLLNSASNFFKELYELGARRVAIFGIPPLGCIPIQRTLAGGIQRNCAQNINDAAQFFNAKLSNQIDSFNQQFPDARNVYIDVYGPLLDIIINYQKYGFKVGNRGCCGTGIIEVVELCNQFVPTCPNDSEYVFWDSFHPTEIVYKTLISPIVSKYLPKFL